MKVCIFIYVILYYNSEQVSILFFVPFCNKTFCSLPDLCSQAEFSSLHKKENGWNRVTNG